MVTDLLLPKRGIAVPKPPSYIRGDWRFSEGSGLFLGDHSRYRNHGTIDGATWSTVRAPGCLSFDGNDFVGIDDAAALRPSSLTLEAWVNQTTQQNCVVIGKRTGPSWLTDANWQLELVFTGTNIQFSYHDGTSWKALVTTDAPLTANKWLHIVVTFQGTTGRIYVDGSLNIEATDLTALNTTYTSPVKIGRGSVGFLKGLINGLRILGIALSASEVLARYNATT